MHRRPVLRVQLRRSPADAAVQPGGRHHHRPRLGRRLQPPCGSTDLRRFPFTARQLLTPSLPHRSPRAAASPSRTCARTTAGRAATRPSSSPTPTPPCTARCSRSGTTAPGRRTRSETPRRRGGPARRALTASPPTLRRPVRKTVHNLHAIAAHGAHCALAVDSGDPSSPHSVMLATAVGAPVDLQYTEFRPTFLAMASHTVVAADEHSLFAWSFLSPHDRARDVRATDAHPRLARPSPLG